MNKITIIDARPEDAGFIADNIAAAMTLEETPAFLEEICRREDTLYSWKNTRIALVDGKPAGSITTYGGDRYQEMRKLTFTLAYRLGGVIPGMDAGRIAEGDFSFIGDETGPGEYYLDSLAVSPEFRGMDIGRMLVNDGLRLAAASGYGKAGLIAEKARPWLHRLYESCGFEIEGEMLFMGEPYMKMVRMPGK